MPIQRTIIYKALGLYTFPNQYAAPAGSMSATSGIFIDRPGVVESARDVYTSGPNSPTVSLDGGFDSLQDIFPTYFLASGPSYFAQEQNSSSAACGNVFGWTNTNAPTVGKINLISPSGSTSSIGQRVTALFEANQNVYFVCGGYMGGAATAGPSPAYRYDSTSNPVAAFSMKQTGLGMPEAPVPTHYFAAPAGGFASTPTGCPAPASNFGNPSGSNPAYTAQSRAYRALFTRRDGNGNLIRGAPSGRHVVYNPGSNFGIQILGIQNLYAGDIVQLYASEAITSASNTGGSQTGVAEPSDEMYQVAEYIVASADITRTYIGVNDIQPDPMRGAALYTNATQDGILMAEQPPPPASLATYFKDVAWYAGVSWRGYSSVVLNILGTAGWATGGSATTFTIAGTTYTAAATENLSANQFALYNATTNGSASTSVSQMVFMTARSLCRAINYNNNKALAVFASPPNSPYAQILIKAYGTQGVGMGDQPGTITITGANVPAGTITPATGSGTSPSIATTHDNTLNRLYYSRPNQPEAVPDVNFIPVGSPNSPITGLAAVRDSLFVFKPEGLYRVTGTTSADIRRELFDATVKMVASRFKTIAIAGNQIFALCNQGVTAITESGCSIISRAIEDALYQAVNEYWTPSGVANWPAVGCASDTERKYILVCYSITLAHIPTGVFVYNFANNTWVQEPLPGGSAWNVCCSQTLNNRVNSGAVSNPDQIVYTASASALPLFMYSPIDGTVKYQQASWTYTFAETENPSTMRRYLDITIITQGSGATPATMSITFNSDSGASPVTQTVTPYSVYGCKIQVPAAHSYCGQLQVQITGPAAGTTKLMVSEVQIAFEPAGERVFR